VPLPQAATTLSGRLDLGPVGQHGDVALGHVRHEDIFAADAGFVIAFKDDLLELAHFVGAERQWAVHAHLDARPAVVVVAGGDHGDAFDIEVELGVVGHRRQGQADVVDFGAAGEQAGNQGLLYLT
jgi:hypothetical protein